MPQDYPSTSDDEFALGQLKNSNSRLLSGSLPLIDDSAPTSETSHRLKSILERFDNTNREIEATPRASMPPTPSEPDSDFDYEPAQTARHSIRSLIENALREPGDTPQKLKLSRRASFNASDSPKVNQSGPKNWSDEEREAQLRNLSQVGNDKLALNFHRSPGDQDVSPQLTPQAQTSITPRFSRLSLQTGSTIRPKSRKPINVYRLDFLYTMLSDKDLEPFRPISSESGFSSPERAPVNPSRLHKSLANSNPRPISPQSHKKTKDPSKTHTASGHLRPASPSLITSRSRTPSPSHGHRTPSPNAWPVPPPPGSSPSSLKLRELSHRRSDNSLKDGNSSSNTSTSATEYRERIKDLDRERERELELGWNRHRSQHLPTSFIKHSSRSTSSTNPSQDRQHGKSLNSPRSSQGSGSRPGSPTSSRDENIGELHERERNWNSPIPKWNTHDHALRNASSPTSQESSSQLSASFHTPHSRHIHEHTSQSAHSLRTSIRETSPLIDSEKVPEPTTQQQIESSIKSNTGSFGRNSRPKLMASNSNDSSTSVLNTHTPFRKGHRRITTTEVSGLESNKQPNPVPPSFTVSDSSTESFEPPHMSTPTSKSPKPPTGTPPASPPLSPNGSFNKATMQADLARLQKAVPGFTFPPRSSPQSSNLTSTMGTADWKDEPTPSTTPVHDTHTPLRLEQGIDSTYLKTPRLPGAFGTPYSQSNKVEHAKYHEPSSETTPVHDDDADNVGADSLATPAPPGAYRMTPGTAKRKGILKVRFNDPANNGTDPSEQDVLNHSELREQTTNSEAELESPTRRKGLRLVDEYGRVRKFTEDGIEVPLDRKGTAFQLDITKQPTHSLSGIEPVNVVEKTITESSSMVETAVYDKNQLETTDAELSFESKDKKAVVSHLTKSLGEMQAVLTREEEALGTSVPRERTMDNGRLNSLAIASKTARLEREKLFRRLESERDAEGKIQSKSSFANRGPWWLRKWRLLLFGLILELCFLYLGYRIALVHSKHLWLGTHFDPFYPALYIHKSHVKFLNQLGTLPVNWSAFTVPATIPVSNEMGYAMKTFGKRFWDTVLNWKLGPWESWGDALKEPSLPQAWPS
ncbi:hypothetical protein Clacol_000485 [Clathrus columnatus]|uniref:Uncharacterized protein n=1 Tax=Clathrus columnatus TaxID=1419009 RepID=A0AAV5A0R1_9AGAM|nr:hypothetical protein Clacol_000485 [Clathrus columnatus]